MARTVSAPVYPRAQGAVNINDYIPIIYSRRLLIAFHAKTVLASIANTDYQGQIQQYGDSVVIRLGAKLNSYPYEKGMELVNQQPERESIILPINKGRYISTIYDQVDLKQTDIPMIQADAEEGAIQMKEDIESAIFADIFSEADAANQGDAAGKKSGSYNLGKAGAPLEVSKNNILDVITDCMSVLSEQNVPNTPTERWMLLPVQFTNLLLKSELKDAAMMGDRESAIRRGAIGVIANFTIFETNLLSSTTDSGKLVWNCIFGTKKAFTFASQFTNKETLVAERTFGRVVRMLQVYGYKVTRPYGIGHLYATAAAAA